MNTPHGAVLISVIALPLLCLILGAAFWLGRVYEAHSAENACTAAGGRVDAATPYVCILPAAPSE